MEPFEVTNNGQQMMAKVAGDEVLGFLKTVFDLEAAAAAEQASEPEVML